MKKFFSLSFFTLTILCHSAYSLEVSCEGSGMKLTANGVEPFNGTFFMNAESTQETTFATAERFDLDNQESVRTSGVLENTPNYFRYLGSVTNSSGETRTISLQAVANEDISSDSFKAIYQEINLRAVMNCHILDS